MVCANPRRATVLAVVVFIFFLAQMVACYMSHSLTLLMNTYQTLFNLMSLILIVISQRIASTKTTLRNTFGWVRMEVVGTLVAILFLFALCFAIATTSMQTMFHSGHEKNAPGYLPVVLVFGVLCLSLNIFCHLIIGDPDNSRHPGSYITVRGNRVQVDFVEGGSTHQIDEHCERSTKERKRYLSEGDEAATQVQPPKQTSLIVTCLRTTGSCITVIICAIVVHFAEKDSKVANFADSAFALITAAIIVCTFYPDVRKSCLILLQTVPEDVELDQLQQRLLVKFPQLINLHDLHIWALNEEHCIATIHITLKLSDQEQYEKLSSMIEEFFLKNGIDSVTIQPEFCEVEPIGPVKCALKCDACTQQTCCIGKSLDHNAEVFATRRRVGSKEILIETQSYGQQKEERKSTLIESKDD